MAIEENKCVFCERVGQMTGEHLFPDWIRKVLPRNKNTHERTTSRRYAGEQKIAVTTIHDGPLGDQTVDILCDTCNNKWGGNKQNAVSDTLKKLIVGYTVDLDDKFIGKLVTWVVMTVMVIDQSLDDNVISREECLTFKQRGIIPDRWKIYIGKYKGVHETELLRKRRAGHWGPLDNPDEATPAIQYILITMGKFLIHVTTCNIDEIDTDMKIGVDPKLLPIYPRNGYDPNIYNKLEPFDDPQTYILGERLDIEHLSKGENVHSVIHKILRKPYIY